MTAMEHAQKLRRISGRIGRLTKKLADAQRDLCAALTDAAEAAKVIDVLTTAQTSEVVAPKDEDGGD